MIVDVAAGVIEGKMVTDASCMAPASASFCMTRQPAGLDRGADHVRRRRVDDDEKNFPIHRHSLLFGH